MTNERILLVEDERAVAHGLRYGLQSEGFAVPCAETGQAALKLVREQQPQLIFPSADFLSV